MSAALCLTSATVASATSSSAAGALDPGVKGCDVLLSAPVGHDCLLPWPNDAFTVASRTTPTHRQLAIPAALDPTNLKGTHVATTSIDRGDGFSPGSLIMTYVPALDPAASHLAPSTDIGASLNANAGAVLVDTVTGVHTPYFAELDAQSANPAEQLLLIHPATALVEGHRYAVVLRNLVDTRGQAIAPGAAMDAAWNATSKSSQRLQYLSQLVHHDLAGVLTGEPYLAWDFTVASSKSLAGPALAMHTLAYAWLKTHAVVPAGAPKPASASDQAPAFSVTTVTTANGVRDVHGTFQVPLFLKDTSPYSAMVTTKAGAPEINGKKTWTANFICVLPATISVNGPAQPTVYGHGLLGDAGEVEGGSFSAGLQHNLAGCATDWVGMSSADVLNVARNLQDMSTFNTQTDHMLQGLVNFQFLGRLLNSPDGFASSSAFRDGSGHALFKLHSCTYMGYSQGGIMGGAVSAVSTEWTKVILGVPGMDYGGLLLNRSVDWDEFASIYTKSYTDPVDQQIVLQLAQLLWDRGENDGYVEHLTANPYPGIPAKQVFMIENYGDHQVSNQSGDMLARTIGAANHQPAFNPSFFGGPARTGVSVTPQWGLSKLDQTKPAKAGVVLWDYGTPSTPTVNLPPDGAAFGSDPHGYGRGNAKLLTQITTFLTTGVIPDVCGAVACQSLTH